MCVIVSVIDELRLGSDSWFLAARKRWRSQILHKPSEVVAVSTAPKEVTRRNKFLILKLEQDVALGFRAHLRIGVIEMYEKLLIKLSVQKILGWAWFQTNWFC